ncbi:hypothetical protein A5893_00890 [Pedobacter psychrophilus]|uniref:Polysaccharide lyase 14 domain-containing protein n=1 Tax=Pedobacter psychrophilus TaxID=1826909 RepID=A0A179DMF4_9SPHI|nr:hypothetical protein [Pedobacter psychrophilus]OAQ41699.1 hypothetical protein A5893_00890 [Pedobacter psychrophilus]
MKQNLKTAAVVCLLAATGTMSSCKKDVKVLSNDSTTSPRAIYDTIDEKFNSFANGAYYYEGSYISKFGNNSSNNWFYDRTYISNPTGNASLRIKLMPMATEGASGVLGRTNIIPRNIYHVSYRVKFSANMDLAEGGKLGVGLGMGPVLSGENNGVKPNVNGSQGGSARLMWKRDGANWKLKPYLYYTNMPVDSKGKYYGTNIVYTNVYPSSGSISRDTWYTVDMTATSNTGTSNNGTINIKINGTTVLYNNQIYWGNNSPDQSNGIIKAVMFDTFRGGNDSTWESNSNDSYIYYDDIIVN